MSPSQELKKTAEQVAKLMAGVTRIVIRDDQFQSKDFDITLYQLRFLKVLFADRESTMRQLSDELGVSPSSATVIIDRLMKQTLVLRRENPDDRRFVKVRLSKKGEAMMERFGKAKNKRWLDILKNLNAKDRGKFLNLLEQWLELLKKSEAKRLQINRS